MAFVFRNNMLDFFLVVPSYVRFCAVFVFARLGKQTLWSSKIIENVRRGVKLCRISTQVFECGSSVVEACRHAAHSAPCDATADTSSPTAVQRYVLVLKQVYRQLNPSIASSRRRWRNSPHNDWTVLFFPWVGLCHDRLSSKLTWIDDSFYSILFNYA